MPKADEGELTDLLGRDKTRRMTYVAEGPGKDVREARLRYGCWTGGRDARWCGSGC